MLQTFDNISLFIQNAGNFLKVSFINNGLVFEWQLIIYKGNRWQQCWFSCTAIWCRPYATLFNWQPSGKSITINQPSMVQQTTFYRLFCVYCSALSILVNGIRLVWSKNATKAVHCCKHKMIKSVLFYFLFRLILSSVASQLRTDKYTVLPKGFWSNISSNSLIYGHHFTFCCHEVSLIFLVC